MLRCSWTPCVEKESGFARKREARRWLVALIEQRINHPRGQLAQAFLRRIAPNAHDYAQLNSIYSHLDGGGTGGGGGGNGRGRGQSGGGNLPPQAVGHVGNDQASWGQLISRNGRIAKYVFDFGNGNMVFTLVILA